VPNTFSAVHAFALVWRRDCTELLQANLYYKLLVSWTNQQVRATHDRHNVFDFKHVQPFDRSYIERPGPCVLFASPGMVCCHVTLHHACTLAFRECTEPWLPFSTFSCILACR
jgi:Cft2 family RNA processing exonuclease